MELAGFLLLQSIALSIFYTANAALPLILTKVNNNDGSTFTVTFTTSFVNINQATAYVLNTIQGSDGESNHYGEPAVEDAGSYTSTFSEPFPALTGEVVLILHALDANNVELTNGGTTIKSFPESPSIVNPPDLAQVSTNYYILRLSAGNINNFDLIDVGATATKASNDHLMYYLGVTPSETYSLCYENDDTANLLLCFQTFTGINTTPLPLNTGQIDSATLKYNVLGAEIEVTRSSGGNTKFDIIYKNSICEGSGIVTCSILNRENSYDLRIIGLDTTSDEMVDYTDLTLTDYKLEGQQLLDASLEMRWDSQERIPQYLIKVFSETSKGFTEATVDCDPGTAGIPCFGYFTGLTNGESYQVSVQPGTIGASNNINIIISLPITISITKTSELLVTLQKTNWHPKDLQLDVEVCFSHANQNQTTAFSHYEFVLLNQKGQFLKHYLMTENTEGDLCFTRFPINTNDFHVSGEATLIVLQRSLDGFAILASGEIQNALNV